MQVGISSAVFYPMEVEKSVSRIIDLGFKKCEVFINCECEYSDSFIDDIRARLDAGGVEVVSMHPYTSLIEGMLFFTPYPRRVEDALNSYRRCFRAASRLGAKYFTFHGDRSFSGTVKAQIPIEAHCDVLRRLVGAANDYGIVFTQENVSWCSSADPEYLLALRDNLGGKLGFTLDLKQARRAGVDVAEYIRVMGSDLKNIHISDYSAAEPCLLPGEGEADYVKFLRDIASVGYSGDLLIEVYSSNFSEDAQLIASKKLLEEKILQTEC